MHCGVLTSRRCREKKKKYNAEGVGEVLLTKRNGTQKKKRDALSKKEKSGSLYVVYNARKIEKYSFARGSGPSRGPPELFLPRGFFIGAG